MVEKIYNEWESNKGLEYAINIPTILIAAYCKQGFVEKAEALMGRVITKGEQPKCWALYSLAIGYLESDQPQKAVEMIKRAILVCEPPWRPSWERLVRCLEYLKGVGDMDEAQELIKSLLDRSLISVENQEKLLNAIKS